MTLTEQWKKGELPDGFYYFKMPDGAIEIASEYRLIRYNLTKDADKIEILAPVPSYEEWERVTKYANKCEVEYIECANDYEKLKEENQQLKEMLLQIRNRQSLIREYLSDCKLGNTWDLLYQTENEITNAIGEKNAEHC
jgi:siderophore synthetase component